MPLVSCACRHAFRRSVQSEPIVDAHFDSVLRKGFSAIWGPSALSVNPLGRLGGLWQHGSIVNVHIGSGGGGGSGGATPWVLGYTRLEHSCDVARLARLFARAGHAPSPFDALALKLASYFHDAGHLALSHTGDILTRRLIATAPETECGCGFQNRPRVMEHEVRSATVLRAFLRACEVKADALRAADGAQPLVHDRERVLSERVHELFDTCAWLMRPGEGRCKPPQTAFVKSPLSAITHDEMDLDRCSYLVLDVPPQVRAVTARAAHAWVVSQCPRSERFLVKMRALLHAHVYPASTQKQLETYALLLCAHDRGGGGARHALQLLCAEATSPDAPALCDFDLSQFIPIADTCCRQEVDIAVTSYVLDEFLHEARSYAHKGTSST